MGNVAHIDLSAQKVTVSRLHDGSTYELAYDQLLIAMGTADNLDMYPGLKEHSHCLKTYDGCVKLKNHILQMFERASVCPDAEERKALLTFVVAGGGYAGTEIAGEISDYCRILTSKEYKHISRAECRSILVCKTETILPELRSGKGAAGYGNGHPKLVTFAGKHSEKLGVEVMLNTKVEAASATHVYLSDGIQIPTRTIINAVGTKPQPVVAALDVPKDAKGRILCNADMTVKGWHNVWAGGDCAAVPHPKGDNCPAVGIFALKTGKHFAKNVLRRVRGKELRPFNYVGLGQGISIGKRTAVVELKGVPIKGLLAWILWRVLLVYYFPTWDRRIRLIADWIMWLFVGRDIVEMNMKDAASIGLYERLYQPGEPIARDWDSIDTVQLITSGEAEVMVGGHAVGTLGKGDSTDLSGFATYGNVRRADVWAYAVGEVRTIVMKKGDRAKLQHQFTHNRPVVTV
jgi:NADH dehydrogenase